MRPLAGQQQPKLTLLDNFHSGDQQNGQVILLRQRTDAVVLEANDGVPVDSGGHRFALDAIIGAAVLRDDAMLEDCASVGDHRADAAAAHRLRAEDLHHRRQGAVLGGQDLIEDADAEQVGHGGV